MEHLSNMLIMESYQCYTIKKLHFLYTPLLLDLAHFLACHKMVSQYILDAS